ncbi:type VI secretion system baseplate subunit TssG [Nitrosomonas communis]|uniref:Type VI secretion system protein ImpH n=1 Tax=Nitrosomonas communis TaxID=44574 RepID=A0A1H2V3G5_9PROT|nr:type VI secretion system baseplate subunit TssG [Nitrosomonas communis]SDW62790.1 type VI secretion system protein ImpH [Nitrosomonas communis]
MRKPTDSVVYFRALQERPYDFDFFQALRHIEALFSEKPRLGHALRPADEAVRLGQEASLSFAPATLSAVDFPTADQPARIQVRFFGMLGPNGPLPLHLTEYARDRLLHVGDATFIRFLDLFHHRFLLLFYRAWAQAQPVVSLDRPKEDRFASYLGSLFGVGDTTQRERDEIPDYAKLFYSGLLARQVRNSAGLAALLIGYFRIPVHIEEFVGHRMIIQETERTYLGVKNGGATLGQGAVLGSSVWDCQHKFRIHLGPLTLEQYESFLPDGTAITQLVAWVRQYLCFELEWDAQLVLSKNEVPQTVLGNYGRLGWTTWLGNYTAIIDASDLLLDAERLMTRSRQPTRGQQGDLTAAGMVHPA